MRRAGSRAVVALMLLGSVGRLAPAQDTAAVPAPRRFTLDTARMHPFHRVYEMLVRRGDSTIVIGRREVDVVSTIHAGLPGWLLTETRSGTVPATDSLYLSKALRPLHWGSSVGLARLGAEFVGDSIYGAVTTPMAKQNLVLLGGDDVIVTGAMADVLLQLFQLAAGWTDSARVLEVDAVGERMVPAQFAVLGDEKLAVDSQPPRPVWLVTLRSDSAYALYWVAKSDGSLVKAILPLPPHVGTDLEYRLRASPPVIVPSSPAGTTGPPPTAPPATPATAPEWRPPS